MNELIQRTSADGFLINLNEALMKNVWSGVVLSNNKILRFYEIFYYLNVKTDNINSVFATPEVFFINLFLSLCYFNKLKYSLYSAFILYFKRA